MAEATVALRGFRDDAGEPIPDQFLVCHAPTSAIGDALVAAETFAFVERAKERMQVRDFGDVVLGSAKEMQLITVPVNTLSDSPAAQALRLDGTLVGDAPGVVDAVEAILARVAGGDTMTMRGLALALLAALKEKGLLP